MKVFIDKRIKDKDELDEIIRQIKEYDLVELEEEARNNIAPWWHNYIVFEYHLIDGLKPCKHEGFKFLCNIDYNYEGEGCDE